MDYILRTNNLDGGEQGLQLFSDEDELTAYLEHLILISIYDGTGPLVAGIWTWNENDLRRELMLEYVSERPEGDFTDRLYVLTGILNAQAVTIVRFTVSVDMKQAKE